MPTRQRPRGRGLAPSEQKSHDRARDALTQAQKLLPGWRAASRMLARNPKLNVTLSAHGTSMTNGKELLLKVPLELADMPDHNRDLCGERGEGQILVCPACSVLEEVNITLIHEVAHIVCDTFEKTTEYEKMQVLQRALKMASSGEPESSRMAKIQRKIDAASIEFKDSYLGLAGLVSPYLPILINASEDIRVNSLMQEARPGTKVMFEAQLYKTFEHGILQPDGTMKKWDSAPLNAQAMIAVYCKVGEYDYKRVVCPEVAEALDDPDLDALCEQMKQARSVKDVYLLSIPLLENLRRLGFMRDEEDEQDDEPEPEEPGEGAEPDQGEPDESGSDDPSESDDSSEGDGDEDSDDEAHESPDSGDGGDDESGGDDQDDESEGSSEDDESDVDDGDSDGTGGDDAATDGDADEEAGDNAGATDEAEDAESDPSDGASGDGSAMGNTPLGSEAEPVDAESDEEPSEDGADDGQAPGQEGGGDPAPDPVDDDATDPSETPQGDGKDNEDSGFDPDTADMGDPDEVGELFTIFGQHEDVEASPSEKLETNRDEDALEIAIEQMKFFDSPSLNIRGVNEHDFEQKTGAWQQSYYRKGQALIEVPEGIMATSLQRLRILFADNARGRTETGLRSGKVNARALARRAPVGDDRIFKKTTQPGHRDYFVVIGLDVSGSTDASIGDGLTRIDLIKAAAGAKAELLSRLGINFAMYAHSGALDGVDIFPIKLPKERWGAKTKERLDTLRPYSANLDGHTMEYYRKVVEARSETDRMILYYTDGAMPAANYHEELDVLQREIKICKQQNIHLVGVGVQSDSPKEHGLDTILLDEVDDIPEVIKELRKRLM